MGSSRGTKLKTLVTDSVLAQTYPVIASTRESFNLDSGVMVHQANLPSAITILQNNECPGVLAIYVHGVWATEAEAEEQTQRVFLSLAKNGYHVPVIGYSWDSDTAFSLDDVMLQQKKIYPLLFWPEIY